jgi:hypothetical protein
MAKHVRALTDPEETKANAREMWLREVAEHLEWFERFLAMPDQRLAWYTEPGSRGYFDNGITSERIEHVISLLKRAAAITFRQKDGSAQRTDYPSSRSTHAVQWAREVAARWDLGREHCIRALADAFCTAADHERSDIMRQVEEAEDIPPEFRERLVNRIRANGRRPAE